VAAESLDALLAQSLEGALVYRCLRVVAELGVADLLAEGPLPIEQLAARCSADPLSLARVLRLLAPWQVFLEQSDGLFAVGPLGQALRTGVPGSARDRLRAAWQDLAWASYGALPAAVSSGRPAFDLAFGMPVFDYFAAHPEHGAAFDRRWLGCRRRKSRQSPRRSTSAGAAASSMWAADAAGCCAPCSSAMRRSRACCSIAPASSRISIRQRWAVVG
jgi:hypothetical protein